jgi:hypothetical protein
MKKKVFSLIISFLFLFSLFSSTVVQVKAQESDDYWNVLSDKAAKDLEEIKTFNEMLADEKIDNATILVKLDEVIAQLDADVKYYNTPHPTLSDSTYEMSFNKLTHGISTYNEGLKELRDGLKQKDKSKFTEAENKMDAATQEISEGYNGIANRYESEKKTDDATKTLYLIGSIISSIISGLFFMLFIKSRSESDPTRKYIFGSLLRTSLIITAGFLITTGTYFFTSDGHYIITYGAILFGGISLVRQLFVYFTKIRPRLNKSAKSRSRK